MNTDLLILARLIARECQRAADADDRLATAERERDAWKSEAEAAREGWRAEKARAVDDLAVAKSEAYRADRRSDEHMADLRAIADRLRCGHGLPAVAAAIDALHARAEAAEPELRAKAEHRTATAEARIADLTAEVERLKVAIGAADSQADREITRREEMEAVVNVHNACRDAAERECERLRAPATSCGRRLGSNPAMGTDENHERTP